jgi:hypothetical protein
MTYIRRWRIYIFHVPHQGIDSFLTETAQVITACNVGHCYHLEVAGNNWEVSIQLENKVLIR